MDFLDIENYENLMQIHKLNKDIHLLKLESSYLVIIIGVYFFFYLMNQYLS